MAEIINIAPSVLTPVGFFVLRTPLLPFANDLVSQVRELLQRKEFRESIYLASPDLSSEVEKYLNNEINGKEKQRIELSIIRYYLRSVYRCTPFGLFAGTSIGIVGQTTQMTLFALQDYRKNTRLDTHFLSLFIKELLSDNIIRSMTRWYPNNTVYKVGEKLRYVEYRIDKTTRTHHLTHVDFSDYVQLVLDKAKGGSTTDELIKTLQSEEVSDVEAKSFIDEMIAACLLVSELEPLVTGKEYHVQLIEKLKKIPEASLFLERLVLAVDHLKAADDTGIGVAPAFYEQLLSDIRTWKIDFDPGKLFQCDLFKPSKCQVNGSIVEELNKSIILLSRIASNLEKQTLQKFKDEFGKRYESQEIPLLEVLDSEIGIGYPVDEQLNLDSAPLLTNLLLRPRTQNLPATYAMSNNWSKFLLGKFQTASSTGAFEIELTDIEVNAVLGKQGGHENTLPDSAYTLCSILAFSGEGVDDGKYLIHHEVTSGPSAVNLLGRFCHMNEDLSSLVRESIEKEEGQSRNDCLFAEIVHIPQARLGNILMRPILRAYEIPILTRPATDDNHVISLSDLMISIRNGRIILRSKRLNKEVIPRLTTAHNFSANPLPHYHLLGDLQSQGVKGGLSWNWGPLREFPFLPRVRYGKTILSKARWTLSITDLTHSMELKAPEIVELIKNYFRENRIPSRVTISQGDNQLPINIKDDNCLKILTQDLKKYKTIYLHECLFDENSLLVKGPEGSFTNELVIPWFKKRTDHTSLLNQLPRKYSVQRSFLPGSKWHYIKIYCGVKMADKILVEVIGPLTEQLLSQGLIKKYFFIRYSDPDHHLRLRFLGDELFYAELTGQLNLWLEPYLRDSLVSNIQTEIYRRELERYGAENIDNSEAIFFVDSIASLKVLSLLEGDEGDQLRWQFAIKGVNDILSAFGFDLVGKSEFISKLSAGYAIEFNVDNQEARKQLSNKYRDYRTAIELALRDSLDEDHEFFQIWKIFERRMSDMAESIEEIHLLSKEKNLSVPLNDLVASYIHMFLNRFLRSKQRLQEMVIYDLLNRYYKSLHGRIRQLATQEPI